MSQLSAIPPVRRRRFAMMLMPVGLALVVIGLMLALSAPLPGKIVGVVIGLFAAMVLGISAGFARSAAMDRHEAAVDAAIRSVTGPCGFECGAGPSDAQSCATSGCTVKAHPRS